MLPIVNWRLALAALATLATFLPAFAADAGFTLGTPRPARICNTPNASGNAWLSANVVYSAMATVAPSTNGVATSAATVAGAPAVCLAGNEAGFAIERIKPEYYLGDMIEPPANVDWSATYDEFLANGDNQRGILFDPAGEKVFVTEGGTVKFTWVRTDGSRVEMTYVTAAVCLGRPKRIYWTDEPYNAPAVNLSGKFVKFFGSPELLSPKYATYTNIVAGVPQVIDNRIVSGLVLDSSSHLLYAYGEMLGQVVMAYYDTGTYDRMLHVQAVEICRPDVNIMQGEIGHALKPDGRGYDTTGLRARPTAVSPADNRGEYLYQHQGQYSYSPKNGNVYPLRPTKDCRWNAEIYWMETDEMEVEWPFELDHYECDWPKDATVFVRGDKDGDFGRSIYIPTDYTPTLMSYQEPEGHARAPEADGTFMTTASGYSLLSLVADDNIWFLPVHSVMRSDPDYFTLVPEEIAVGKELMLRGGSVAGLSAKFSPECDPDSPGYIYEANSSPIWNPNLYSAPTAGGDSPSGGSGADAIASATSGDGTNEYASVIYAVTANAANPQIEVWWNTTIQEADMSVPITIPTLPQVYAVRWPEDGEAPQIVIASQKGSDCESTFMHNNALYLSGRESWAQLAERAYFSAEEGTVMFWMRGLRETIDDAASIVTLSAADKTIAFDWLPQGTATNLVASVGSAEFTRVPIAPNEWHNVALAISNETATLYIDGSASGTVQSPDLASFLGHLVDVSVGAFGDSPARQGVEIGELLFWNGAFDADAVKEEMLRTHDGLEGGVTGCYAIFEGIDLNVTGNEYRMLFEKVLDIPYLAYGCLRDENGPPARGTFRFNADGGTTPVVYVQNDSAQGGYNPNEEHAFVRNGGDGCVAWALRSDLNTADSSAPGVLVEYVRDGSKRMQYFGVVLTNDVYTALADDCIAGKAIPGPHPLDLFDDPWRPETYWDEAEAVSPAHRDRKGQLWARAAGTLTVHMYYPMQEGFAFPQIDRSAWPAVGASVPWLSLLDESILPGNVLSANPAAWTWSVEWPDEVPEMEIGRTLTVAASGLPEVWNAKSVGVVWPATEGDRDKTALLFDPTVAQKSGFPKSTYATLSAAIADLGIKQGAGGNATLRKGKWTFDGLPPSISSRFYLDTTADVTECLRLVGEQEDNAGGVSLLHVNVLSDDEREKLETLLDDCASDLGKIVWRDAIATLATAPVKPSPHRSVTDSEAVIDYSPRDHYALFSIGATNYVTIIENDSTNELMNIAEGDPINMHVFKVVPKYYTGRVVTREDPLNLLSQQLSVIYAEAFAGKPEDYVFEWRKCAPHLDGSVPTDFDGEYVQKFAPTNGLTRFTIGHQGDTLANMVNTYYAMRYKAASESSPAYAAMGDAWSEWTDPPALAEGWVQRVLNNVTPFTQRMRDLVENEAETAVSMIRQAGAPYEGDVALNQDNLPNVGLLQLYETLLSKAESMSLQMEINDADANKQLQLAVARLADLYNLLGDEAYSDALNPTIGFGSAFNSDQSLSSLDYGALSSALFCFDNQVPTLLDEELALLRGRSAANAPSTRLSPYYNRLVWNFTRGMNAGEVAYAVNYDISGNNKGVIDYSQAAEMYPQGHGDAYGHYLSALSGYYRLLRNPYFSWGAPAMGEMVVADSVVNVDYYDEAQFAKAAHNVAKTALEVVDRTARKAYRDNAGATGSGYMDSDASRNFGYGEWASRGGFAALCNWAVGNSLLEAAPSAQENGMATDFDDEGLNRIDRGTVQELSSLAAIVPQIQKKVDQMDSGLNPVGLAKGAIPFDIDPYGEGGGASHYEQIRARAGVALANARSTLEKAQTSANRMRKLQESQTYIEDSLEVMELEFKNKLIEYFGYPYEGDIGPGGTYAQGYDGPDLYHYAWMVPEEFGCSEPKDTLVANVSYYRMDAYGDWLPNLVDYCNHDYDKTFEFEQSATGIILKPASITGKRRAQGKIQDAMADMLRAYTAYERAIKTYEIAVDQFQYDLSAVRSKAVREAVLKVNKEANLVIDTTEAYSKASVTMGMNSILSIMAAADRTRSNFLNGVPQNMGGGLAVITDPRSLVASAIAPAQQALENSLIGAVLTAKNMLVGIETIDTVRTAITELLELTSGYLDDVDGWYTRLRTAAGKESEAAIAVGNAYKELAVAQKAVETVCAEAERVIDERTLKRTQAVDKLTKMRYNEMFFRVERDNALTRYSSMFDLAQKYAYLAAQAYDYETGLISSDSASGEKFIAEIVGARTLGEFAADGTPVVTSGDGDGGLADILARLDANWLVLKPRLGINNPQPYATWFSLRHELFRIYADERGDKQWKTALEKCAVEDLNAIAEFRHYCQPLSGSTEEKEPGFVIEFPSQIVYGYNFFGEKTTGGDSPLDPTWYATHIASAGVHFEGYNDSALTKTPTAYLVPVGEDRMRSVGDPETVLSWKVVDQTIPAPYAIGSTQLDDPDWMPLYDGATGGNDLGARIRKHPSFRAYYAGKGLAPSDAKLDCTRLVGRSAWNTRWLLIIPAGAMNANREDAMDAFANSVSDIKLGLKTYSASGN